MARPLLIALLTVTAVAWPVAAHHEPTPDPGPAASLVTVEQSEDGSTSATVWMPDAPSCLWTRCKASPEGDDSPCRVSNVSWGPSEGLLPNLSVALDPDGCLREAVDDVWPFLPHFVRTSHTFDLDRE